MTRINSIIVDDEPIAREILENHLKRLGFVKILASCKNALEAFQVVNKEKVDLIFLDINMPEITGLSFARSINKNIKIIFTTAYREYAVDGFDLQAVDYLLKPISFERLLQAVNKFSNENVVAPIGSEEGIAQKDIDSIFVRADRKMVKIRFHEIIFIESLSDYLKIHTINDVIVTRETISNIEARIPFHAFIRVHRSYIVAMEAIDSYTNEIIEVGKKQIPISRGYRDSVLKRLGVV